MAVIIAESGKIVNCIGGVVDSPRVFCDNSGQIMNIWGYKILLFFLRFLIYSKRALACFFKKMWEVMSSGRGFIHNSIGFRFYKLCFNFKKKISRENLPWFGLVFDAVSRRGVLEVIFFLVALILIYPHSRLYAVSSTQIPGRTTALFHLLGPGEQDFSLEEVNIDYLPVAPIAQPSWREGAVMVQPGSGASQNFSFPDTVGITMGGSSLLKPNILTGASFPQLSGEGTGRTEIVIHEVQAGDTIGGLAEKYRISAVSILWANNLTARSYIRPGDKLNILPVSGLAHKVKKGETVSKIAKLYNTSPDKIFKFNKLKEDGSDLVIGEELLVPDGVKPAPVYVAPPRTYPSFSNVAAPPSVAGASGAGYLWPTTVRRITQYFGWRHTGVDIAGPVGTPIYASSAGVVTKSQCGWNGGYGCYIIIDHGSGITTLYSHNSRLYVSVGESIAQGQTIALMGSTGRSTGPHVHFEVRVGGRRVNPLQYTR